MKNADRAEAIAQVVNAVLLQEEGRPAPYVYQDGRAETTGGRVKGGSNWRANTVIAVDDSSVYFSVLLSGGPIKGYMTDILNGFADDTSMQKYARHALTTIYKRNGWELITPQE